MNVDDAMEAAAAYLANEQEGEPLFCAEEVAITLAAEVERLRAELAEAKAASVPPVKFSWCYESNECDIIINGMSDEDSTRLGNWLHDRTKERGEG